MSAWLLGSWASILYVAASAVLIYLSTVLAIRYVGQRRTLTEMTVFDFTVAVALGATVARTATTPRPTYAQGLAVVITLLVTHNVISALRLRFPPARRVFDRGAVVLVTDGRIDDDALRRAHLTADDLATTLREHGVGSLAEVRSLVLESRGTFSVLRADAAGAELWPRPR